MRVNIADPAGHEPVSRAVIAPGDISFMICVEGNVLGSQALLLCESLRRFGGPYADCAIWAISPRAELPVSPAVQAALEGLGVRLVSLPLNTTGSTYGSINRIVSGAWAESQMTTPYIGVLDTDMIFVRPPTFVAVDAGVRPVDYKGMASAGVEDERDAYWAEMCALGDIPLDKLPMLHTTCCQSVVRASYNGGFLVVRRSLGILAETDRIFFESYRRDLRPTRGAVDVYASIGNTGAEAASWWGSSQAALSIAISKRTDDIFFYDNAYNIPLHIFARRAVLPFQPGEAVLVHYHYLAAEKHRPDFLKALEGIDCPSDALEWVSRRCGELDWPIAG